MAKKKQETVIDEGVQGELAGMSADPGLEPMPSVAEMEAVPVTKTASEAPKTDLPNTAPTTSRGQTMGEDMMYGLDSLAVIKVVGIGGGGCNAVSRMVQEGIGGVQFIAVNTDAQALCQCDADYRVSIGDKVSRGLGAGASPEVGRKAVEESIEEIRKALADADMVVLTAGMGGGTGTGASPIVAEVARSLGALTVAIVTKPFSFEGRRRMKQAEEGIEKLRANVDAIITIPNDRILGMVDQKDSFSDGFRMADNVLRNGVQGISEIITVPGTINVDFADVRRVMENAGSALLGIGRATGENRAEEAAKAAISSPLLETSIDGATGVLMNITAGPDFSLAEASKAAGIIHDAVDPEAEIIWGVVIDERLEGEICITVIATGFQEGVSDPFVSSETNNFTFEQVRDEVSFSSHLRDLD